ncbi:MAG: aminotransferase class III-fold pyridoxal phosphate-dependent enzyme, partial [Solirubrobacterales bacterium]|nr:aminotransferase class III-fold pyridoxal phosphate-dependent enzyme [Solirubrobacterales bacterium]
MTGAEPTTAAPDTSRSAELYRSALGLLPGGVNSPVRAMRSIGRDPIFIAGGAGAIITDVDGNDYVDWVCSWGPLILGHAHPGVLAGGRGSRLTDVDGNEYVDWVSSWGPLIA